MTKYLTLILVFICIGIAAFEIESGMIRFGGSYWKDTTSTYMSNNKSVRVNGDINFTGTLYQNGSPFSSGSGIDTNKYYSVYRLDTSKLFYERDTTNLAGLKRNNNTFQGINADNITANTITGSISASDIVSGTLSDSRLGNDVALTNDTNLWRSKQTFRSVYFNFRSTSSITDSLKIAPSSEDIVVIINASNGGGNTFNFPDPSKCSGKFAMIIIPTVTTVLQMFPAAGHFRGTGYNDTRLDLGSSDQMLMFYSDGTDWYFNPLPF